MNDKQANKPSNKKGLISIYYGTVYSLQGLKAAIKSETALRQELFLIIILIPVTFFLDVSASEQAIMIMSLILIPIIELINSAVEALADRISTERHELLKKAKDVGSAAVFLSLVNASIIWAIILFF